MTETHKQSDSIILRLRTDAATRGRYSNVRMGTIDRLEIACDDILSGKAYELADTHGYVQNPFPNARPMLSYILVEKYVNMRQRLALPDRAQWTGPKAGVIGRDADLRAYVDARRVEAAGKKPRRVRGNAARAVEEVLAKLPIEERYLVRSAIEQGRAWKMELDVARQAVKLLQPVSIESLNPTATHMGEASSTAFLSAGDTELLRDFLLRFKNPDYVDPFGLVYSGGNVKMAFPPSRVLIEKSEMEVIARLAGMPL